MSVETPRPPQTPGPPPAGPVDVTVDETPTPTVSVVSLPVLPAPLSGAGTLEPAAGAPRPLRRRAWSPGRAIAVALALGLMAGVVALLGRGVGPGFHTATRQWLQPLTNARASAALVFGDRDEPEVAPKAVAPAPAPPVWRADARLDRALRSPQIANGIMTIPPSFSSADGAYDLVVHFNGNPDLVEESFAAARVNAVVVILNLGIGSGVYEDYFADTQALPEVLRRVQSTMEKRGLVHARLRRLGLTAWSAGYGAVAKILEQPGLSEQVESVILLDGIHIGFDYKGGPLLVRRLAPFEQFARQAVTGKKFFLITHSEIPSGRYAGTHVTTDVLLRDLGVERKPGGSTPPMASLRTTVGVVPHEMIVPLEPLTVADRGGLHVRGYAGDQPRNHSAHLIQMSTMALPALLEHWSSEPVDP